jgi:hypothetical protein
MKKKDDVEVEIQRLSTEDVTSWDRVRRNMKAAVDELDRAVQRAKEQ